MLTTAGIIPYRRQTDPLILPVSTTSTRTAVPNGYIPVDATSFRVTNPNAFWVRLKGSNDATTASSITVSATEGWLFPPGFSGTFTTQFPTYMATLAVGAGAGNGTLEISYGIGGGGESASITSSGGSSSVPTGTAGSPNTSVVTVQGVAGATPQPVTVGNFPTTQTVSGTVSAAQSGTWTVSVSNFPSTQPISGSVSVSNFPATQTIAGSVSVSNFPATQPVSGTVAVSSLPSIPAGTNLIGAVQTRGTGSMVTGQVAMSAQNTTYQVAPARATRRSITFVPTSQFTYFYGNSGVTTATGAAAINGAAITLETTAAVFVVSSSTGTMTFVEHF